MVSLMAFFATVGMLAGPRSRPRQWPNSLGQFLVIAAIVSLVAWLAAFLWQLISGKRILPFRSPPGSDKKVVMCNRCYQVKSPDDNARCDCGGEFEDFDLWKWVDD
jgi:hypothetical protein